MQKAERLVEKLSEAEMSGPLLLPASLIISVVESTLLMSHPNPFFAKHKPFFPIEFSLLIFFFARFRTRIRERNHALPRRKAGFRGNSMINSSHIENVSASTFVVVVAKAMPYCFAENASLFAKLEPESSVRHRATPRRVCIVSHTSLAMLYRVCNKWAEWRGSPRDSS